jgi:hypothetical protein
MKASLPVEAIPFVPQHVSPPVAQAAEPAAAHLSCRTIEWLRKFEGNEVAARRIPDAQASSSAAPPGKDAAPKAPVAVDPKSFRAVLTATMQKQAEDRLKEHPETGRLFTLGKAMVRGDPTLQKLSLDGTVPMILAPLQMEDALPWGFLAPPPDIGALKRKCKVLGLAYLEQIVAETAFEVAGGLMERLLNVADVQVKDVDLWCNNLPDDAFEAECHKVAALMKAGPWKGDGNLIWTYRSRQCLTLRSSLPGQDMVLQFICRRYSDSAAIVYGFDIGACQWVWNRTGVHTTWMGDLAYAARVIAVDLDMVRHSYESRLVKYWSRGYNLALPDLDVPRFRQRLLDGSSVLLDGKLLVVLPPQHRAAFAAEPLTCGIFTHLELSIPEREREPAETASEEVTLAAEEPSGDYFNYSSSDSIDLQNVRVLRDAMLHVKSAAKTGRGDLPAHILENLTRRANLLCGTARYEEGRDLRQTHGYYDGLGDLLVSAFRDISAVNVKLLRSAVGADLTADLVAQRMRMAPWQTMSFETDLRQLATELVKSMLASLPVDLRRLYEALPWSYEIGAAVNFRTVAAEVWYACLHVR